MGYLRSNSAYRQAAASGATQIGLLLIAYDALAADLLEAGEAVRRSDIPSRCKHSNHGLLLLGHLESWVQYAESKVLAPSLNQFYRFVRDRMLNLQGGGRPEDFEELAKLVAETRAAWRLKEQKLLQEGAESEAQALSVSVESNGGYQVTSSAWSA